MTLGYNCLTDYETIPAFKAIMDQLKVIKFTIDYLYFLDSYWGVYPEIRALYLSLFE